MSIMTRHSLAIALALALTPLAQAEQTHSASWWDPADSGWGLATLDQGNVLGPYWFTYDEEGKPAWFMGIGLPQPDGSYAGDLYRFTGTPFAQIGDTRANQPGSIVGTISLAFDSDPRKMSFTTRIDGETVARNLTRFNFSGKDLVCRATSVPPADLTNYSGMWWEPATSGWGINVMHLDEQIFGQWYTYEAPDRPVFMTLDLTRQGDGSYAGTVWRQKDGGRSFKSSISNQPSQPGSGEVGSASLIFLDGAQAEFDYVVGEDTGHHVLQRFQFGNVIEQCSVQPYDSEGDSEGDDESDGELCHPPYRVGDSRKLRATGTSNGSPQDPHTFTETITGSAIFNGHSALVQEFSGQTSSGNGVYARNYLGNGDGTLLSFGAEALDPSSGQIVSTSRNDPSRVEAPRRFQVGETVSVEYGVDSSSAAGAGRTEVKTTYRLLGREQVSVPAGSFNACKFEVTIEESSSVAGVSTRTLLSGHIWNDAEFGPVRQQFQGTNTVNAFGYNTTTELTSAQELLEATMNGGQRP